MTNNSGKATLRLDEGGRWLIRSTSLTVCYLDLDTRRLLRDRGPGSQVFPYDGQWVPLIEVRSQRGDVGVIRVGDRHEFLTDPAGGAHDFRFWIPRVCVAIEPVTASDPPIEHGPSTR